MNCNIYIYIYIYIGKSRLTRGARSVLELASFIKILVKKELFGVIYQLSLREHSAY